MTSYTWPVPATAAGPPHQYAIATVFRRPQLKPPRVVHPWLLGERPFRRGHSSPAPTWTSAVDRQIRQLRLRRFVQCSANAQQVSRLPEVCRRSSETARWHHYELLTSGRPFQLTAYSTVTPLGTKRECPSRSVPNDSRERAKSKTLMPHLIKELSGKYERCRFRAGTVVAYRVASAHLLVERSPCPLRHSADLEGHRTDVELTLA